MKSRTIVLAGALVLAASAILSGCSATDSHPVHHDNTASQSSPSTTPTPTAPPKPDGTLDHPYPEGTTTVTDTGSQWDVTLTKTSTDATKMVKDIDQYAKTPKGDQFVMGTITATVNNDMSSANAGASAAPYNSVMPVFVGGDGKIYSSSTSDYVPMFSDAWTNQPDIIDKVGVKSTGVFAFPVPTSAISGGTFGIQNTTSSHIVYFK